MERFCTAVNCMDGRVQVSVVNDLRQRFAAEYVDVITEPGPNRILAEATDDAIVASIERRISISVNQHHSVGIAVIGHYDCAGNPSSEGAQRIHTLAAVRQVRKWFSSVPVVGLWVNAQWQVSQVSESPSG